MENISLFVLTAADRYKFWGEFTVTTRFHYSSLADADFENQTKQKVSQFIAAAISPTDWKFVAGRQQCVAH